MKTKNKDKKGINIKFIILLLVLIIGGGIYGFMKWQHAQAHEETDDAQLESNITAVIPRVSGYIKEVRVKDNDYVHKGDTLIILDDRDFKARVAEAESAVDAAQSQVGIAEATVSSAQANVPVTQQQAQAVQAQAGVAQAQIGVAEVEARRANADYVRYNNLYKDQAITKQQWEQALAAKQKADEQLRVLQQQVTVIRQQSAAAAQQSRAVQIQSGNTGKQIDAAVANVKRNQTVVETAKINLSYTVITAPSDGYVSRINLQPGQMVNQGQSLFNLVNNNFWVIANFKETQMEKIVEGNKVVLKFDAFPNHKFDAKVTSISPATGSKFALLPPDNASGNFVKVVQRVPIKIEFVNPKDDMIKKLRPGMNVAVDVEVK